MISKARGLELGRCIVELIHLGVVGVKLAFVSRIRISVLIVCVVLVKMHFAMQ